MIWQQRNMVVCKHAAGRNLLPATAAECLAITACLSLPYPPPLHLWA